MKKFYEDLIFRWQDGEAYHLEMKEEDITLYILNAGSPKRIEILSALLETPEIHVPRRGLTWVRGYYKDIEVMGFTSGMGVGSMGITLMEVMTLGLKKNEKVHIIRVGTSGPFQPYIPPFSLIIPTAVVRDESATDKVIYREYPADMDPIIYLSLFKTAVNKGYKPGENLFIGKTHSKDDLYFYEGFHNSPIGEEHKTRFQAFKEMGVLATEMEASLLPIYRDYFNVMAKDKGFKTRFYVGGLFTTLKSPMSKEQLTQVEEKIVKLALESMVTIDKFWKGHESLDMALRNL